MLKERKLNIKINNNMLNYYRKLNKDVKIGDIIEVDIENVPQGTHNKVISICDKCEIEKIMEYRTYYNIMKNKNEYLCKKCSNERLKKILFDKYGVNHALQVKEFKQKQEDTLYKNYGVLVPIKSEKIRKKIRNTTFDKFGTKYASQNEIIKNKMRISIQKNTINKYSNTINIIDIDNYGYYILICEKEHEFKISNSNLINRLKYHVDLCTICNPIDKKISNKENKLNEFINDNYSGLILKNKKIINGKEIDIYIPDLKLGFEFNGIYWHNELNRSNDYHLKKTEMSEKQGIKLIHIYEDDWIYKQKIVKSHILNLFGKTLNKIYARKCVIKEISDNKLIRNFLNENHLQGFVGSKIKIGLFYNNELVSLMIFGKLRKSMETKNKENIYEILRFCSKINTSVVGGAEKLFKCFIKNYRPKEVISYADRSWSQGELYYKLKFTFVSKTKPNYYYVIDYLRHHRFNFRKDKLIRDGFDTNKSEHEIMLERKIYRIYDSGSLKFKWKI